MALVFDSDAVDPRDRADMMADAIQRASAPAWIKPCMPDEPIRGCYETWDFGTVGLTKVWLSGLSFVRTPRQIRVSPSPALQLVLKDRGLVRYSLGDTQYEAEPGRLFLFDLNRPCEVDWSHGAETILSIPLDILGLPAETIRRGLEQLPASPLYPLAANQIATIGASADTLEADTAAHELGAACVEMVRALVTSAAALGGADGTAVPAQLLLTQIRGYIRQHITDSELGAARIARAHHISVRYLYKLCAQAGFSIEQRIIRERLERARGELVRPENRHRSIAIIAHACGFRDPGHFTRRFRLTYGLSPSDWRRAVLESPGAATHPGDYRESGVVLRFPQR